MKKRLSQRSRGQLSTKICLKRGNRRYDEGKDEFQLAELRKADGDVEEPTKRDDLVDENEVAEMVLDSVGSADLRAVNKNF